MVARIELVEGAPGGGKGFFVGGPFVADGLDLLAGGADGGLGRGEQGLVLADGVGGLLQGGALAGEGGLGSADQLLFVLLGLTEIGEQFIEAFDLALPFADGGLGGGFGALGGIDGLAQGAALLVVTGAGSIDGPQAGMDVVAGLLLAGAGGV